MTGRVQKRFWVLGAVLAGMALLAAFHARLLPYCLKWLDVGEQPRKADVIFVHLGDEDVRPFVAAALYRAGFAPEILVAVANQILPSKYSPASHLVFQNVMRKRGVPDSAIHFLGEGVDNTMNESDALRDYLLEHPRATVLVVTTHFHTRRTRWSLRRSLGPLAKQLHYVSCPHDDFDETNWWLFPGGFKLVLMEYVKLAGYWVIYGNAVWYAMMLGLATVAWGVWRWQHGSSRTDAVSPDLN